MAMKKPPWSEWVSAAMAVVAAVTAVASAFFSCESAEQARRQAAASERVVEETKAPDLRTAATYLQTPVPDPRPFISTGSPEDTTRLRIWAPFLGSGGRWHVIVRNDGDAVAKNVKIRAPGIFYARHAGFATGTSVNWSRVENEAFTVGDLGPDQLFKVVLWIRPNHNLARSCIEPGSCVDVCIRG